MKTKIFLPVLALCSLAASQNAVESDHFMDGGSSPAGDTLIFPNVGWPGGIQRNRAVQTGNVLFRSFRPPDYPEFEPTNKITFDLWLNIDTFTNTDELRFWAENVDPTNSHPFEINANDTGGTVSVYLISQSGTNGGFFTRPSSGTNHFAILMDRTTGTNCGVTVYTNGVLAPFTQTHSANMDSSNFESVNLMSFTQGEPERHANAVPFVSLVSFRILAGEASASALFLRGMPQPHPSFRRNWFGEIVP